MFSKIEAKANLFWDKVQEEGVGSSESEQHSQWRSSMACGSTAKLQATHVGTSRWRWTLASWVLHIGGQRRDPWRWFHEPPVNGKSVTAHGSTATTRGGACLQNGDRTLGFCKLEAKEEICNIGFAKGWRKTSKSEGRLELMVWRLWLLLLCLLAW